MCCIQNSFSIKRLFVLTLLFSLSHSRCHVFACEISLPSRHLMMKKGGSKYVVIRLEFLWWKTFFLFFESLKKNSKVRWEEKNVKRCRRRNALTKTHKRFQLKLFDNPILFSCSKTRVLHLILWFFTYIQIEIRIMFSAQRRKKNCRFSSFFLLFNHELWHACTRHTLATSWFSFEWCAKSLEI